MNGRVGHRRSTRKPRRYEGSWEELDVPDGCQWARRCEGCPWPDCVLNGRRYQYHAPEARQIRGWVITVLRGATGLSLDELAAMFHFSTRSVYRYMRDKGLIGTLKARRNEEIVRAKRDGRSTKELAGEFGPSERTVRRIAAGGR